MLLCCVRRVFEVICCVMLEEYSVCKVFYCVVLEEYLRYRYAVVLC